MDSAIGNHTQLQHNETKATNGSKAETIQSSKTDTVNASEAKVVQAQSFTVFKKLPQEAQDAIWKHAIDSAPPRIVEIRAGFNIRLPNGTPKWTGQYTFTSPIPSLLHTCCSSRRLALKRWRLSFAYASQSQPAKIFFDFSSDILYFGHLFDDLNAFIEECKKADRLEIRKIAFHLLMQYESEYFDDSTNLALRVHKNFPKLDEVVFVEKDVHYDWERHDAGLQQRRPDPKKTVVTFQEPRNREPKRAIDKGTLNEFVNTYEKKKWNCPEVRHADYERSRPWSATRPVKPIEDADVLEVMAHAV